MKKIVYILMLCICFALYGSVDVNNTNKILTNFHMIKDNSIQTMNVIETETSEQTEPFIEIEHNEEVADVNIDGLDEKAVNILIAKRILDFEGEKLVNNSTEYSKYGITIQTLRWYNAKYKTHYRLEKLKKEEAIDIMINLMNYYKIDKIKDPRIRIVIFDTLYNAGPARAFKIAQKTFNFYNDLYGNGKRIKVDGIMGSITLEKLNSIQKVDLFIQLYTFEKLENYKNFREWDKYKKVWCERMMAISQFRIDEIG